MKIILFSLFLTLIACNKTETPQPMEIYQPPTPAFTSNYLALGDSYTIGEGVLVTERWPVQLAVALGAKGFDTQSPQIIARTGWTTDELAAAIEAAHIKDTFDLVSLLIGVNNQYRGRSVEQFRVELVELINTSLMFAGGDTNRFFMLSIPDWSVTPFAQGRDRDRISREIDSYNEVIRQETNKRNILFVDITRISREASSDLGLLAPDQLHPSGKMYRRWVDEALPRIVARLQQPK